MASTDDRRTQRPELRQIMGTFKKTPDYIVHRPYEDQVAILVCQIKIWEPKDTKWFDIPAPSDCLCIRECESIEVTDSAKELMGKCVLRFPRGTVIHKSSKKADEVKVGNTEDNTQAKRSLKAATNDGEFMSPSTARFSDTGVSTTSMCINYDDMGLLSFNKRRTDTDAALLQPDDIATGNRIEIRVGYAYSENEFNRMNASDGENMDLIFTGFITSLSVDTPLEIECTNMAHVLTTISTPDINAKDTLLVKDFLDDGGAYHLLQGTGIELAESSKNCEITVHGGTISNNLTVADVLEAWCKAGIDCVMENRKDGKSVLRVGYGYNTGLGGSALPNDNKNYLTYKDGDDKSVKIIQFDWDVAEDKLGLKRNDKDYVAIEARGWAKGWKLFKLTIRKDPNSDGFNIDSEEGEDFDVVNEREVRPKKHTKRKGGTKITTYDHSQMVLGKVKNKAKMKEYSVIPYMSTKIGITREELIEEAKQYWRSYSPNGISGTLTIFGDLVVHPSDIVGLVDLRQPEKNGYYYVEAVNTSFGLSGYRRELKLPYKVMSYSENITIIE